MPDTKRDRPQEIDRQALFELMEQVGRRALKELHREVVPGLPRKATLQQMIIGVILMEHGGRLTVSEVAGELGVSLSAVTSGANRMGRLGLLSRFRDGSDHRVVWLELTASGQEAAAAFLQARDRMRHRLFESLSSQDLKDLSRILSKLNTPDRSSGS